MSKRQRNLFPYHPGPEDIDDVDPYNGSTSLKINSNPVEGLAQNREESTRPPRVVDQIDISPSRSFKAFPIQKNSTPGESGMSKQQPNPFPYRPGPEDFHDVNPDGSSASPTISNVSAEEFVQNMEEQTLPPPVVDQIDTSENEHSAHPSSPSSVPTQESSVRFESALHSDAPVFSPTHEIASIADTVAESSSRTHHTLTSLLRPDVPSFSPGARNAGISTFGDTANGEPGTALPTLTEDDDPHISERRQAFLRSFCRGTDGTRYSLLKTFQLVLRNITNVPPQPTEVKSLVSSVWKLTTILYDSLTWDRETLWDRSHQILAVARDIATYSIQPNTRYTTLRDAELEKAAEGCDKTEASGNEHENKVNCLETAHDMFQLRAAASLFCAAVSQAGPRCRQWEEFHRSGVRSGPNNPIRPIHGRSVSSIVAHLRALSSIEPPVEDCSEIPINFDRVHRLEGGSLDLENYMRLWDHQSRRKLLRPSEALILSDTLLARSEPSEP